jgi:hypothetical protein
MFLAILILPLIGIAYTEATTARMCTGPCDITIIARADETERVHMVRQTNGTYKAVIITPKTDI